MLGHLECLIGRGCWRWDIDCPHMIVIIFMTGPNMLATLVTYMYICLQSFSYACSYRKNLAARDFSKYHSHVPRGRFSTLQSYLFSIERDCMYSPHAKFAWDLGLQAYLFSVFSWFQAYILPFVTRLQAYLVFGIKHIAIIWVPSLYDGDKLEFLVTNLLVFSQQVRLKLLLTSASGKASHQH